MQPVHYSARAATGTHRFSHYRTRGFTITELLVIVTISGLLLAIVLPAVQMARESARRTECKNHLRQLAMAMQSHHETYRYFPTGGWGHGWVGDPKRGFGEQQPGGWVYNTLPFIEQQPLRKLPADRVMQSPLPVFHCPTRRYATVYPYQGRARLRNADHPVESAKSDYAINGGDTYINSGPGPISSRPADLRRYDWPDLKPFTGVSLVRSRISMAMLRDGTSTTYLLGEKYISAEHYSTGQTPGDDQTMYLGDDADIRRWTIEPPLPDGRRVDSKEHFGSAHSSGCHFAFCDGSVRFVNYQIDTNIHRRLGNRRDRIPVNLDVLE